MRGHARSVGLLGFCLICCLGCANPNLGFKNKEQALHMWLSHRFVPFLWAAELVPKGASTRGIYTSSEGLTWACPRITICIPAGCLRGGATLGERPGRPAAAPRNTVDCRFW